jgi:hypothetical protein
MHSVGHHAHAACIELIVSTTEYVILTLSHWSRVAYSASFPVVLVTTHGRRGLAEGPRSQALRCIVS